MDAVILIYNVLLLIAYSVALTLTCIFYTQTKKALYLYGGLLFLFYIFDNLIIYMTEFVPSFSTFYNNTFMSVPTFKTIIYVVTLFCMVRINAILTEDTNSHIFDAILILYTLILLFIPMMENSAMKVFLYYTPSQLFTFALGFYGLRKMKVVPERFHPAFLERYRKLLKWTMVISILVIIEDIIVIFNVDVYTDFAVKINTRSLTSDIMYTSYALYAIWVLAHFLQINTEEKSDASADAIATAASVSGVQSVSVEGSERYSKFYLFCRDYQLTVREQDILTLLLENKNNQEISDKLMISVGTAKTHTHNIFQKLGVAKRQQLFTLYDEYTPKEEDTIES